VSSRDQGDKSGNDITPVGVSTSTRPKSFIDVVSIIEGYFLAEKDGNSLPSNLLTLKGKIIISEVGFKGAAISGIISILLTPFCVGVLQKYIPIFGSYEFTLFDEAFAMALTISFALGYGLIIATIGKYYIGNLSKRAINWLMMGLSAACALKIVIAFVLYNMLYVLVLDPHRTARFLLKFHPHVAYSTLDRIYTILMEFKPILLTSANFVILTTLLMICVPWIFIYFSSRRTKKLIKREEMWK